MATKQKEEHVHAKVDALLQGEKGKGVEHLKKHHNWLLYSMLVIFTMLFLGILFL